jgi:rhodanese-related sulfurtransferase
VSYAGDVQPEAVVAALQGDATAMLVDVRTRAEWTYVGLPEVSPPDQGPVLVEWQRFPDGRVNDRFVDELREAGVTPGTPLYFLCRSGVRSVAAATAATAAGYTSYNVLEGFEGETDRFGERTVNGWKNRGLPTNLGKI